ncbi:UNVERIFIED_CONTAM: hypothetical protein FKN15_055677 [Acipenser sinensis]
MDLWNLIEQINEKAAAQKEQFERWEREMGLTPQKRQEREPTELELLLQKWEQARVATQSPEPEEEEPPLPEPRGEEPPLPEPRGEEVKSRPPPQPRPPPLQSSSALLRPVPQPLLLDTLPVFLDLPVLDLEPRSLQHWPQKHTSTTAPTTTPTVQFGAAASSPSTVAPGHPAGLPRPPCAGPGAQESAALATALPLVPCSALPEHPDVAGLLPDVAIAPPVRCFAPPG